MTKTANQTSPLKVRQARNVERVAQSATYVLVGLADRLGLILATAIQRGHQRAVGHCAPFWTSGRVTPSPRETSRSAAFERRGLERTCAVGWIVFLLLVAGFTPGSSVASVIVPDTPPTWDAVNGSVSTDRARESMVFVARSERVPMPVTLSTWNTATETTDVVKTTLLFDPCAFLSCRVRMTIRRGAGPRAPVEERAAVDVGARPRGFTGEVPTDGLGTLGSSAESIAYDFRCSSTGEHSYLAELLAAGQVAADDSGTFHVGRCRPRQPDRVNRETAARYAAREIARELVTSSRCASSTGAPRAGSWSCRVQHSNTYRACTTTFRLRFTVAERFGRADRSYSVRRVANRCRFF